MRLIAFNGHARWGGFQQHLLPEPGGTISRSVQLRNAGRSLLATATALCSLTSLLKPRAKSFLQGTPSHGVSEVPGQTGGLCVHAAPLRASRGARLRIAEASTEKNTTRNSVCPLHADLRN